MERKEGLGSGARAPRETSEQERSTSARVLIITSMKDADACGREIAERAEVEVEVASNRRAALAALRRSTFEVVLVQENLAEGDPGWADQLWQLAATAFVMQVNFGLVGCVRLGREVKAALARRESERASVRRVVAGEFETDLKLSIASLLVESELALQEPEIPDALQSKLRRISEMVGALQIRIDQRALQPRR